MPRSKKIKPEAKSEAEPEAEATSIMEAHEPITISVAEIDEPIQAVKKVKTPKEKKPRSEAQKEASRKMIEARQAKQNELINQKALELFEKMRSELKSEPKIKSEPIQDEIFVVKKKVKKAPPRKKVIYIEDDDVVEDIVQYNHPQSMPTITYW